MRGYPGQDWGTLPLPLLSCPYPHLSPLSSGEDRLRRGRYFLVQFNFGVIFRAKRPLQTTTHQENVSEEDAAHEEDVNEDNAAHEENVNKDNAAHEENVNKDNAAHEEDVNEDNAAHEENVNKDNAAHEEDVNEDNAAHEENAQPRIAQRRVVAKIGKEIVHHCTTATWWQELILDSAYFDENIITSFVIFHIPPVPRRGISGVKESGNPGPICAMKKHSGNDATRSDHSCHVYRFLTQNKHQPVDLCTGLPRHRENREFESPFFQTGKTQGIC